MHPMTQVTEEYMAKWLSSSADSSTSAESRPVAAFRWWFAWASPLPMNTRHGAIRERCSWGHEPPRGSKRRPVGHPKPLRLRSLPPPCRKPCTTPVASSMPSARPPPNRSSTAWATSTRSTPRTATAPPCSASGATRSSRSPRIARFQRDPGGLSRGRRQVARRAPGAGRLWIHRQAMWRACDEGRRCRRRGAPRFEHRPEARGAVHLGGPTAATTQGPTTSAAPTRKTGGAAASGWRAWRSCAATSTARWRRSERTAPA